MAHISTATGMKWHNLNLSLKIKLSDGAMWLIAIFAYLAFCLIWILAKGDIGNFLVGSAAIVTILKFGLNHEDTKNQLDLDAAKANVGANLNAIKVAAAGIAPPAPGKDPKP